MTDYFSPPANHSLHFPLQRYATSGGKLNTKKCVVEVFKEIIKIIFISSHVNLFLLTFIHVTCIQLQTTGYHSFYHGRTHTRTLDLKTAIYFYISAASSMILTVTSIFHAWKNAVFYFNLKLDRNVTPKFSL